MFWLVVICIALVIVFVWCCSPTKGGETQKTVQQAARPVQQGTWSTSSPYDICYVLAYMVGNVARYDPDERSSMMLVTVDKREGKTRIYASFSKLVSDPRSAAAYEALGMPKDMAQFLAQVPFQPEASRELVVEFNQSSGVELLKESINNGLNALSWKPAICQLKSYTAQDDYNKIHIDLFAARD